MKKTVILTLCAVVFFPLLMWSRGDDSLKIHIQQSPFYVKNNQQKIGWEVSGNFGLYLPNKHHAQFYNGDRHNVNNLEYIFSNYYWRQEIVELMDYNASRDSFQIYEIPANIKYDAAMHVGFSARYNFSDELALNISVNYSKLQVRDVFTLQVFPPYSGMLESFVYCGIFATEGRTNIDIGGMYTISPHKQLTPFWEAGLHANSTHVKKHVIHIFEREFNMVNVYGSSSYIPNTPLNEYDIRQGGLGFGAYLSGGYRYAMSDQFSMELLATGYLKTVNLEGYSNKFALHSAFLFRMVLSPFFQFGTDDPNIY